MATSGSVDFNLTGTQIVNRAMRHMGVIGQEETPNDSELADGLEALNVLVKQLPAEGINLWKNEDLIVWLRVGVTKYSIGSSGDHAATTWVRTTLSADAASGAGSLTVTAITGMASADNVGIVLDDGTLQWDTINGAPSGSTVTLTGTLDSAASSGNQVWAYTTKAVRPLRLDLPRRRDVAVQDIPIWIMSRQEYFDTPNKTTQAPPVNVYYDPQLTNGELLVWPAPDSVNDTLLFSAKMPLEDFDSLTNNPDLPQEWLAGLAWMLADEQALEYEVPPDRSARITIKADRARAALGAWDQEDGNIYVQPDFEA